MRTSRNTFLSIAIAIAGIASLGISVPGQSRALAAEPSAVAPPGPVQPTTVTGVVDGYSLNAEGIPSAMTIKDDDRISQFNLPKDGAAVLASSAAVGQKVTVIGTPKLLVGDHAIFDLVSVTGADGKPLTAAGVNSWGIIHVEGTVKQLNFASRGEVDGVILENGDFLHTGRKTAGEVNFTVGEKITADGWGHAIAQGHSVIEPTKINGHIVKGPDHPAAPVPVKTARTHLSTRQTNAPEMNSRPNKGRQWAGRRGEHPGEPMNATGRHRMHGTQGQERGAQRRGRSEQLNHQGPGNDGWERHSNSMGARAPRGFGMDSDHRPQSGGRPFGPMRREMHAMGPRGMRGTDSGRRGFMDGDRNQMRRAGSRDQAGPESFSGRRPDVAGHDSERFNPRAHRDMDQQGREHNPPRPGLDRDDDGRPPHPPVPAAGADHHHEGPGRAGDPRSDHPRATDDDDGPK